MKKTAYLILFSFCFSLCTLAQNASKPFGWRDHLSYNQAFSVTSQGNKIYAVTSECLFAFNKDDNSYQRFNKVTGLSDIEPTVVKNNPYNNAVMVVYKNSNLDIIKNGSITNEPSLLHKQNTGNKTISNVTFKDNLCYLACGFGIAVFDTDALEFKETYIIGPGGTNVFVYQVALTSTTIYAATAKGIYYAPLSASNLESYTYWHQITNLPVPNGVYNGIVNFNGTIIASYSGNLSPNPPSGTDVIDTLYKCNIDSSWSVYPVSGAANHINKISVSNDNKQLVVMDNIGFIAYDASANQTVMHWGFPGLTNAAYYATDAIPDPTEPGWYWETNSVFGLLKCKNTSSTPQVFSINGPGTSFCNQVQIKDDKVIVAPYFLGFQKAPVYNFLGVYSYQNDTWITDIHSPPYSGAGINCVAFDYNDKTHFYAGSFGNGMIEVKNDSVAAKYTCNNSPIAHRNFIVTYPSNIQGPDTGETQVTSLYSDINNNLWITTNDNPTFVTVKKNDNTWASLDFTNLVGNIQYLNTNQIIVDSSNLVWVPAYGTGLFLYKNDGNFSAPNASNSKLLINQPGKGGLPSNNVTCVASDKSNDIWVGTDQGIYVFYSPESILTAGSSGWDAQPIYVQQDGQTQLLLQTNIVTCIFVDGANNKWVGTATSGLFCFSSDGQTELYHFTIDNSPLFSNTINSVNVSGKTGEVFISTAKGLQSFQGITTEGLTNFEDVYAYPNPVKPNYTGPILIHGMVSGATVKIVDGGGNFVYETTSEGGQAIWNGENFKGKRVASGVYMVICAMPDGSQKKLTKILLLN